MSRSYKTEEFKIFFDYVRSLSFQDIPDYNYLKGLIYNIFKRKKYYVNFQFDWEFSIINAQKQPPFKEFDITSMSSLQILKNIKSEVDIEKGNEFVLKNQNLLKNQKKISNINGKKSNDDDEDSDESSIPSEKVAQRNVKKFEYNQNPIHFDKCRNFRVYYEVKSGRKQPYLNGQNSFPNFIASPILMNSDAGKISFINSLE